MLGDLSREAAVDILAGQRTLLYPRSSIGARRPSVIDVLEFGLMIRIRIVDIAAYEVKAKRWYWD